MNDAIAPDPATHTLLRNFFRDYQIRSIGIHPGADIHKQVISQVELHFFKDADAAAAAYVVSFKLLDKATDAHRYLRGIGGRPEDFRVHLTPQAEAMGSDAIAGKVHDFLLAIRERVKKIHREQSILGIRPVGKIFVLNHRTRFKVLADDGAGQLRIKIMDSAGGHGAILGANDLLDGLYVGRIEQE